MTIRRGSKQRAGDTDETLERIGAIDLGSFVISPRDGLQPRQEDDDVIAHAMPDAHEDQAGHGQRRITQPALDWKSQAKQKRIKEPVL